MYTKILGAAVLALAAGVASAQANPEATPNQALTLDNIGSNISADTKKAAEATARIIAESMSQAAQDPKHKAIANAAQNMARRVDDIADQALSADREKVMKFLGIDPRGDTTLYYFVSFEMPLEVLRAYVIEAMWAGGTLVLRGVPPGRDLKDFITKDMQSLIYGKGASAALSIDPRLFDAYEISAVPTIVYTEERRNFQCMGVNPKTFVYRGETQKYDTCPPLDESKYWKITGAVTTDFALREFINAGAVRAQPFLDALAKGFATGTVAPKVQQPYAGDWKSAITPEELMAIQSGIEAAKKAGSGVQPQGQ